MIPGLLQTREYATAVISAAQEWSDDELNRRVELRMKRQERLAAGQMELWAIIDEAALSRVVGSPLIHQGQLKRLIDLAKGCPNPTIQVLPFAAGANADMGATFLFFEFSGFDPLAYVDTVVGGMNTDDPEEVRRYRKAFELLQAAAVDRKPSLGIVRRYIRNLN